MLWSYETRVSTQMTSYNMCPRCSAQGQPAHTVSPVRCGFPGHAGFTVNNWQCATLNRLRELAESTRVYGTDESAALLLCDPEWDGGFIALNWYKNRGTTSGAVWLRDDAPAVPLPFAVAERTIQFYDARAKTV